MADRGRVLTMAREDNGSVALIAVLCVTALSLYVAFGYEHVDPLIGNRFVHNVIVCLGFIISLFTLACALQISAEGALGAKELRRQNLARKEELRAMVDEGLARISDYERIANVHFGGVSRQSQEAVTSLRRILAALQRRYTEVCKLIISEDEAELLAAHDLLSSHLSLRTSAVDALIDTDPLPPIPATEVAPTVKRLIAVIDREIVTARGEARSKKLA